MVDIRRQGSANLHLPLIVEISSMEVVATFMASGCRQEAVAVYWREILDTQNIY